MHTTTTTQPLLDIADLCGMFEESESASLTARKDAEYNAPDPKPDILSLQRSRQRRAETAAGQP
jgi:hypothetical protein